MADVYATISDVDPTTAARLAEILELRAADPRHKAIVASYIAQIEFTPNARVIEIGCGTGAIARQIADLTDAINLVGVDPSPVFIERARAFSRAYANLSFREGDAHQLPFPDNNFDVAIFHTVLCHVLDPQRAVAEAFRVLRPGGLLSVCDGDYGNASVSLGDNDPLDACVRTLRENFVQDAWVVRRLPQMLHCAGFEVRSMQSYGYLEAPEGGYMLTWVDRGADALMQAGRIGPETAAALKAEAQRRSAAKVWFGHIPFASILGLKPA
jgi:ubiquinone/menaquinone biosynthesis C-methylase UbiE